MNLPAITALSPSQQEPLASGSSVALSLLYLCHEKLPYVNFSGFLMSILPHPTQDILVSLWSFSPSIGVLLRQTPLGSSSLNSVSPSQKLTCPLEISLHFNTLSLFLEGSKAVGRVGSLPILQMTLLSLLTLGTFIMLSKCTSDLPKLS